MYHIFCNMEPVKNVDLSNLKPLPQELQNLPQEDAECKYCGIPYLILHEVKQLQTRCSELEAQLVEYNSAVTIRSELEEKLKCAEHELKRLEELPALKSEFGRLHELVGTLEEEIAEHRRTNAQLKEDLIRERNQAELQQLEFTQMKNNYEELESRVVILKNEKEAALSDSDLARKEVGALRCNVGRLESEASEFNNKFSQITGAHKELMQQNVALEGKCQVLQDELQSGREKLQQQGNQLSTTRAELESLRNAQTEVDKTIAKLRQDNVQLDSMNSHLLSQQAIQKQTASLKYEQATSKITNLETEITDLKQATRDSAKALEIFKSNEHLLKARLKEYQETQNVASKRELELKAKHEKLEDEMRVTINSHQSRLEELTEFYRGELEKMNQSKQAELEMEKVKAQYKLEMEQREAALKEYFQVELEIEVEKRVEKLKMQFQHTLVGTEDDLSQARDEKKTLEGHCEDLQRQLKGNRTRSMAVENELNTQIGKLKVTIEKMRNDMNTVLQKQMLYETEKRKTLRTPENSTRHQESDQEVRAKFEAYERKIAELERTIQRECEERMALIADQGLKQAGVGGAGTENGSNAFTSSTLKLLSLSPQQQRASGDDTVSVRSSAAALSNTGPMVYIPQNLADLTKTGGNPIKAPLPSLGSVKSTVTASSRNTNTQRNYAETASVKSQLSNSSMRRRTEEPTEMDTLRRKIRLAIKQRQRQSAGSSDK